MSTQKPVSRILSILSTLSDPILTSSDAKSQMSLHKPIFADTCKKLLKKSDETVDYTALREGIMKAFANLYGESFPEIERAVPVCKVYPGTSLSDCIDKFVNGTQQEKHFVQVAEYLMDENNEKFLSFPKSAADVNKMMMTLEEAVGKIKQGRAKSLLEEFVKGRLRGKIRQMEDAFEEKARVDKRRFEKLGTVERPNAGQIRAMQTLSKMNGKSVAMEKVPARQKSPGGQSRSLALSELAGQSKSLGHDRAKIIKKQTVTSNSSSPPSRLKKLDRNNPISDDDYDDDNSEEDERPRSKRPAMSDVEWERQFRKRARGSNQVREEEERISELIARKEEQLVRLQEQKLAAGKNMA